MKTVYLDNNATTPLAPEVLEAMLPYLRQHYGNPSRPHSFGREARKGIAEAREAVARTLNASEAEIVFTASGTESDNLALLGVARHAPAMFLPIGRLGRPALRPARPAGLWAKTPSKGRHLITSSIEHSAVLGTCRQLAKQGFTVTHLPVSSEGIVSPDDLKDACKSAGTPPLLVSIMHANNDTGAIQPVAELARIAHEHGALFHTDAVQSVGRIPCDVQALGCDLLTFSAHKFHGPKGVGGLYVRKGTRLEPILFGGHQEGGLRPGTENVPGIVGLGRALTLSCERMPEAVKRVEALRDRLHRRLCEAIPDVTLNGPIAGRLPNTLNLSFAGVEGESLLVSLDLAGVAVGAGSACTSGALEPSHVLLAMGRSRQAAQASIRFSLSVYTTVEEIDYVIRVLPPIIAKLRRLSPRSAKS
jgi:cysteine desulfurase